jgi:hypothetical protein
MSNEAKVHVLENQFLKVEIPMENMAVRVTDKQSGHVWQMSDKPIDEIVVERNGKIEIHTFVNKPASQIRSFGGNVFIAEYFDIHLQLMLVLDENRLEFQLTPFEENEYFKIKGIMYPRTFLLSQNSDAYLVAPFEQGTIIPGNWHQEIIDVYGDICQFGDKKRWQTYGELFGTNMEWWSSFRPTYEPAMENRMTMPWWGAVDKNCSFLAVIDEECWADSYLNINHPAGGPTEYQLFWLPSWGKCSYPRRIKFQFYKGGDYFTLAKAYRKIAEDRGKCVTLRQKNEINPTVDRLMGAVNTTISFIHHDMRKELFEVRMSFAQGADVIEEFVKKTGFKLHVSARSWQRWGHDIQYPDLVPPAPEAGGPVEFDRMATRIQQLGCVFGLNGDNYHDVALNSAMFDESMLLRYADGSTNRRQTWANDVTSLICARVALKYLRRNFEVGRTDYPPTKGLLETAHPDTYWIGNYISSYECYDPRHPETRNTYWEAQRRIFQYINDCGLLLNNEHPKDWGAPYFYMARARNFHHLVYGFDRAGDTVGIPVPLWSIIYHDCLISGGVGVLGQMLNGSPPSTRLNEDDEGILKQIEIQTKLHKAVGYESIESHKFLSDDKKVQQSQFSNGVTVTVDENKNTFKISGVKDIPETEFVVESRPRRW